MAVLKQTSPTAVPSAPRPKPSSTVPSASTSSAVGLWSGQASELSVVVISASHNPCAPSRQRGFTGCSALTALISNSTQVLVDTKDDQDEFCGNSRKHDSNQNSRKRRQQQNEAAERADGHQRQSGK